MDILFTWIIASFVVGIIGSNRNIGFWSSFFISVILSPLIGLIFVLTSKSKDSNEVQKNSIADEIEKLQTLKNNNSITEYEFIRLKNKIIDSTNNDEYNYKVSENEKSYPNYVKPNSNEGINNRFLIGILIFGGVLIISFVINYYNSNYKQEQEINPLLKEINAENSETDKVTYIDEKTTLKNFTYEDIARYTMATVMGQPSSIVKAFKKDGFYYVSYVRKSDSQKFDYKVKFVGNQILWAGAEKGQRWRDSAYDEKISFAEKEGKLNIITTYGDGSEGIEEFKKGD